MPLRQIFMSHWRFVATALAVAGTAASAVADESKLIEPTHPFVQRVVGSLSALPEDRQKVLSGVADYVAERLSSGQDVRMIFICTHNSRRSHLSQVWCQVAAAYYGVPGVETYSGGTEATACNIRTVRALRRAGLSAVASTKGKNPVYLIQYAEGQPPIRAYSKVYTEEGNPTEKFAAMMCCADADEQCPVVEGADGRFQLHYEDPKVADGTSEEAARYDERCFQIAQEMFFVMAQAASKTKGG